MLKHLRKVKWAEPSGTDLDNVRRKDLAKDCLAVERFSSSLCRVTKDARSKFRIIGFASSKKTERGLLAAGTKAYKIAANLIVEAGLVARQTEQASNKARQRRQWRISGQSLKKSKKLL